MAAFCAIKGYFNRKKKLTKEELSTSLTTTLKQINPSLEKHEKVEKIVIMNEDWTMENGLLTPTLKTKRNQIEKIYQPNYNTWFNQQNTVIYEQ